MARPKAASNRTPLPPQADTRQAGGENNGAGFSRGARPWLLAGATALLVARLLFPSESAASQGDGMPAVMLWIVLAVVWLLGEIGQPRFRLRFGWIDGAMLLVVAWHTIAALWAAAHLSPRPAVNMLWEWVGFAVGFFLIRQLIAGPREARALVAVMCSMAVALAAFGLYQYGYELPATRAAFEADPDGELARANLWYPPGSPEREVFAKRLESVEPIATFALTNSLAGFFAPWLIVLAGMATLERAKDKRRVAWWGPLLCAVVVAACLLLTKSRSAYLAVLVGLAFLGIAWRGKSARVPWKLLAWTTAVVAGLVGAAIAARGLDLEVLSEAGKSLGYRGQYWRSSLAMIADHPLMGCGPGNFQDAYKAYKLPEASEEIAEPHNFLIELWATAGTPALLALVAMLGGFYVSVLRARSDQAGAPARETSPSNQEKAEKQSPGVVYGGALLGFACAGAIGAVSPAPPSLMVFAIAVPSVCLAAGALWNWVVGGNLSAQLAAIGAAVLLVNLLAAGGIGFAGVAGSLWLLIAIALSAIDGWRRASLPAWIGIVLLATTGGVAYACYASAYRPVLQCEAAMERAQRHPRQMEKHLLEAAQMDPLSAEPWNQLSAKALAEWESTSNADALSRFESYNSEAIRRAPGSAPAWASTGNRYMRVYSRTKDAGHLQQACAAMRRTVELYPNSAVDHANLAVALRVAGDESGYRGEREQALWLDKTTPHLDKKLPDELRKSLERSNSRQN